MQRLSACALVIGLAVLLAAPADAEPQQPRPVSFQGIVTDAQGAVLFGVTVTAASASLAAPEVAVTGPDGRYRLPAVPAGVYSLTFELPGFRPENRQGIVLAAGDTETVDVRLGLAPVAEEQVEVVGVAPVLGMGVLRRRVPANVTILTGETISERQGRSLSELLNHRVASVAVNDATTNAFQQNLRFRGFTASPLLGLPQGVAVYQNGVRINEPFGDTVQFDLIPGFALESVQVVPGPNPVYGLNALGGAIGLQLKNGFSFDGARAEISGGSFGRYAATGEFGSSTRNLGVYLGVSGVEERGWRDESDSNLVQLVGDLDYRTRTVRLGTSLIYVDNSLNGNGLAPVELLDVDRRAVYTFPDNTRNELGFLQTRFDYQAREGFSIQGNAYYRDASRSTFNADAAEFEVCASGSRPAGAPAGTLCEDGDGSAIVNVRTGSFVTLADATGDGVINRTSTSAAGYGASVQGTVTESLFDRENFFVAGATFDLAETAFASDTEIGGLTAERTVSPAGIFIGGFGEGPGDEFSTDLIAKNHYDGVYFNNMLSLTERVHVTLAGRFNLARIEIVDMFGTDLDGDHSFSRFNPAVGATYELADSVTTYASYNESNRSPTAAELSCADPTEPCRVPNAFLSDPPLEQVVSRAIEMGARGSVTVPETRAAINWSVAGFGSRTSNDIIFVASPDLVGTGFFQNAGATERSGLEVDLTGLHERLAWYANYSLVRATFGSGLTLPRDRSVNDAASDAGELTVAPGDRMPGVPLHNAKLGVTYRVVDEWDVVVEAVLAGSQILLGDEGNDQEPLGGYGIVNLRSNYRINDNLDAFVIIHNLFDKNYATFGALAEVGVDLLEAPGATDPRFLGPGAPVGVWTGLRLAF